VRLDEDEIGIPGAERADVASFGAWQPAMPRSGPANARPWRQSQLNKPVIWWMSVHRPKRRPAHLLQPTGQVKTIKVLNIKGKNILAPTT
jgi:hypothetical protein